MLGRMVKVFISSILQRRPSIFKEFFFAWWNENTFISSNLQRRPSIFKEFFMLGRIIKIFFFFQICQAEFIIVSKNNQGSCLGCLGGNDAPEIHIASVSI